MRDLAGRVLAVEVLDEFGRSLYFQDGADEGKKGGEKERKDEH